MFIASCAPVNNTPLNKVSQVSETAQTSQKISNISGKENNAQGNQVKKFLDERIISRIEIILPSRGKKNITKNLINAFELSVYQKKITNTVLGINRYPDLDYLDTFLNLKAKPGMIFVGTLSNEASQIVAKYCKRGILFFSFAADKNLAKKCVYLINFFPEDDLFFFFYYFPKESKIALLYPENYYGLNINKIIDSVALESNSLIISRASYKEDLTNARESIKELGKYELRKNELDRQKNILKKKDDEISKKALSKIKRFETIGGVDFTHIILPDYGIRLLEIAPLLPFYDVDPKKVQFVGTGVWDNKVFFDEPSLQGAVFSGIEESKRKIFFDQYKSIYKENPIRTSTIPHDLLGIISYVLNEKMTLGDAYQLLNSSEIKFDGIDGKFSFFKNSIKRELNILQIENGAAKKLD